MIRHYLESFTNMQPQTVLTLLIVATVIVCLIGLAIWYLFALFGWRLLQRKQQVGFTVSVENISNVDTPFHLWVELASLEKDMRYFWQLGKKRLKMQKGERTKLVMEEVIVPVPEPVKQKPEPEIEAKPKEKSQQTSSGAGAVTEAKQQFFLIRGMANAAAGIAGALAVILPGSLKTPFRTFADGIRKGQNSISQTTSQASRTTSSVRAVKSSARRFQSTTGGSSTRQQHQPDTHQTSRPETSKETHQEPKAPPKPTTRWVQKVITMPYWRIETFAFAPAESADYRLILRPRNPFKQLSGDFTLSSHQIEDSGFPSQSSLKTQESTGSVNIKTPASIDIFLFTLICLVGGGLSIWGTLVVTRLFVGV